MKTPHRRGRVFKAALTASLLVHLSAVTLFRIVIYFPRNDTEFFDVAIVETRMPFAAAADTGTLNIPSADDTFARLGEGIEDRNADAAEGREGLADFRLPTLRFDDLNILRIRRDVLQTRTRYEEIFQAQPTDAWARFGKSLSSFGEQLTRLGGAPELEEKPLPVPISHPAPGFNAYLEWLAEPYDRRVLAVKPIDALWGLDPAQLTEPLALVFRVDRDGSVIDVLEPIDTSSEITEASAEALREYRFEPLFAEGPDAQPATLIVRSSGTRP